MEVDQDIYLLGRQTTAISRPTKTIRANWDRGTRDYLYPIPTDDRSLTGGALTQNPGWNDGLDL